MILEKDVVNTGRQKEVDIAKAIMVLSLAFIHVTINCTSDEGLCSGIPYLFDTIIGGPFAGPMFMFAMGIGCVYRFNGKPTEFIQRGIKLLGLAFLLNLCRYVIPYAIGFGLTGEYDTFIATMPYRFFCNDIMQFAGLFFLTYGILRYIKCSNFVIWIISFVMSIVAQFANDLDFHNEVLNVLFSYFIGTESSQVTIYSDFPIFNWMVVAVSGALFGEILCRTDNKNKLYLRLSPACIIISIIYFAYGITNEVGMFGEGQNCYYHITYPDLIIVIILSMGVLGIYHGLSHFIPKRMMDGITSISKNVNAIYCIHWVIVELTTEVILYKIRGTMELAVPYVLLLGTLISITAAILAELWTRKIKVHLIRG